MSIGMDDLCSEDGQRVYDKKGCCVVLQQKKDLFFCDTIFCLNKLIPYEPSYMVTRNCL